MGSLVSNSKESVGIPLRMGLIEDFYSEPKNRFEFLFRNWNAYCGRSAGWSRFLFCPVGFSTAREECEESPDTMESRDRVIPGVRNRKRPDMESATERIPPLLR